MGELKRWAKMCALSCCVLGCSEPPQRASFRVLVHVEADPQVPLAGAELRVAGRLVGTSDAAGSIRVALHGEPGELVTLQLVCPEGHREPDAPLSVMLRASELRQADPEYAVACPPLFRQLVVAVRAGTESDLPVYHLGQEIARTNAAGVAHAWLRARPGEVLSLTLDTSQKPQLMPQHPELKLSVPDRDELFVFDQPFVRPKPKHRPKPKPPEPVGPKRI